MLNQTICATFKKYGDNLSLIPANILTSVDPISMNLSSKSIKQLYFCENDTFISKNGSVLLLVSTDCLVENVEPYIISERVKLNKGTYFNLIPVSNNCQVNIYTKDGLNSCFDLNKPYTYSEITPNVNIDEIYIRLYQEKGLNYIYPGEKHYFWELTYVDRGVLYTNVEGTDFKLNQGDFMFYSPYQFHTQHTDDKKSCSYLTVCFSLDFEYSSFLEDRVFTCNKELLSIMSKLIKELNSNNLCSSQLCICYLKELLLKSISINSENVTTKAVNKSQQHFDDNLLNEIIAFIESNIYDYIDINQLCIDFGISNAKLQLVFKSNLDTTVRSYINDLKLKKSKDLIRESNYTISQISDMLGFTSIHYFSKKFKTVYGYSPREYLKSVNNYS